MMRMIVNHQLECVSPAYLNENDLRYRQNWPTIIVDAERNARP